MDGEAQPGTAKRVDRTFSGALTHQIRKRGDTASSVSLLPGAPAAATLMKWMSGYSEPKLRRSFEFLARLEKHYGLRENYFTDRVLYIRKRRANAPGVAAPDDSRPYLKIPGRILRWHLPDDFADRPEAERLEIETWLSRTLVNPDSCYVRYLKDGLAAGTGFDLVRRTDFTGIPFHHDLVLISGLPRKRRPRRPLVNVRPSPQPLVDAWNALVRFKTTPITPRGMQRDTVWSATTVKQRAGLMGNVLGVIAAEPSERRGGLSVPIDAIVLAILLVPEVLDAFLAIKTIDRGFLSRHEVGLLEVLLALAKPKTGWLRQSPWLATELRPVEGLVSSDTIALARTDWNGFCDRFCDYGATRARDVRRVIRESRDVMAPVEVVLASPAPLLTYRRIADEVLRHLPDRREDPRAFASAVQTFLMLRIAMHTGLRQKNLRQMMFQSRGEPPTPPAKLANLRRGELQWDRGQAQWRIVLPRSAFKNSGSSFFRHGPLDIALPDAAGLYPYIDLYLAESRRLLLGDRPEPGTFFLHPVKHRPAEYDEITFYNAWRTAIQIYGIYNPWTGRGAIEGLLPHGPHCVRAVLATHVLKATGSFEYAGYAIQDLPDTVEKSYGRFLPSEKSALAARILAPVWDGNEEPALIRLTGPHQGPPTGVAPWLPG